VVKGAELEIAPLGSYLGSSGISGGFAGGAGAGHSWLPPDHGELFITEIRPSSNGGNRYPQKVIVTGNFGYGGPLGRIPDDVEFATRRAVAAWYKEEIARYTADAFISRGRMFEPDVLPPVSLAQLRGAGWIVEDPVMV
jgi:hypothetical protein